MKRSDPTRQLRRIGMRTLCIVAAFVLGVFGYLLLRHSYIAETRISCRKEAGDTWEISSELRSAEVIVSALERVGSGKSVEKIQKALSVLRVMEVDTDSFSEASDTQEYKIILELPDRSGAAILEQMLQQYLILYAQKYLDVEIVPDLRSLSQNWNGDYIERAEILEKYLKENESYLAGEERERGDFRSVQTGYSFGELRKEYEGLLEREIPELYAEILEGCMTKDRELLLTGWRQRIEKNKRMMQYEENILDVLNVLLSISNKYDEKNALSEALSSRKKLVQAELRDLQMENGYCTAILNIYTNTRANKKEALDIETLFRAMEEKIERLDAILLVTVQENAIELSGKEIQILTPVHMEESFSIVRFLTVFLLVLLLCAVVTFLMRQKILSWLEYQTSFDRTLHVLRENGQMLRKYKELPLPVPFVFGVIQIEGWKVPIGQERVLRRFTSCLVRIFGLNGTVTYEAENQRFLLYLEDSDGISAQQMRELLETEVENEFSQEFGCPVKWSLQYAENSWRHISTLQNLMSEVIEKKSTKIDKIS